MSNARGEFDKLIQACEADIRAGRAQTAQFRLRALEPARIPRSRRLPLANLMRRAGLTTHGLRLLAPVVRAKGRRAEGAASPAEICEYAVLLHRAGLVVEPMRMLAHVEPLAAPESLLYQAFCRFTLWDYASAVPLLRRYVRADLGHYQKLVGTVNLAAALVGAEALREAESVIAGVLADLRQGELRRLHGNCLELMAQIRLYQDNPQGCLEFLNEAETLLGSMPTTDLFFVRKWSVIARAMRDRDTAPLRTLKAEALSRRDWESAREADRHSLQIRFDENLFQHLVFGTEAAAYRERVYRETLRRPRSDIYVYGTGQGPILDLVTGEGCGDWGLAPGDKTLDLIEVLSRDFYRPKGIGALFAALHVDERYNPFTSAQRIHQLIFRTRGLLRASGLPLGIAQSDGTFCLSFAGPVRLRLPLVRRSLGGYRLDFERLARGMQPGESFTADSARRRLGLARTTFQRFCQWAIDAKLLERQGRGPSTFYRLTGGGSPAKRTA